MNELLFQGTFYLARRKNSGLFSILDCRVLIHVDGLLYMSPTNLAETNIKDKLVRFDSGHERYLQDAKKEAKEAIAALLLDLDKAAQMSILLSKSQVFNANDPKLDNFNIFAYSNFMLNKLLDLSFKNKQFSCLERYQLKKLTI